MTPTKVPVINVSGLFSDKFADRKAVAEEVGNAIDDLGFFYVTGHQIGEDVIRGMREAAAEFFALSDAEKMKYFVGNSKTHKGFVPEGEEDFDVHGPLDHKEALDIGLELADDHPGVKELKPFHGHNMWPPNLPGFKDRVVKYHNAVYALSMRLMRAFAIVMGLDENAFDKFYSDPIATLRLIHYPDTPGEDGSIGISPHQDFESITILLADAPGLELDAGNGTWLDAPPLPGALLVNIGEMLEIMTNGRVKPRVHRVRKVAEERYSFPFFLGCNYDVEMSPLPEFKGKGPFDTTYNGVLMGDHLWSAMIQTYRYLIDKHNQGKIEIPPNTKIFRKEWMRQDQGVVESHP